MTNTVRTKVTKIAKSELRFSLFVIFLFLLPQLVSIRNEDLQTQTLSASTIASDSDTPVITLPAGITFWNVRYSNTRYSSEFIALIIEISFVKKLLYNLVEKYIIL